MTSLTLHPNAKINLGLLIKGKRPDGYHLLETVLYPLPQLRDEMTLSLSDTPGCELVVSGADLGGDPADNLCVRAWRLLRDRFPDMPGIRIELHKSIPAGAGLGGGSSDAAFTLTGLNTLLRLGLPDSELAALGSRLGADVPFFVYNRPLLATGIGTEFEEIALPPLGHIELITPPIHSATAAAYRALDYRTCDPARDLRTILAHPVTAWSDHLVNDLERPVFSLYPQLAEIKADLYARGAVYAAMSGSGSAVFGVFGE
ncbi:MAG: 4-(cytidine 5'-diphospho)-2-C-methyl-D-erythritol kinase [Bacteroidia bacterium]|nr:4-(cytidine 5'-diphospho)-2-C-methyl-D-erythritol kinase [Bacteroidia bacterium]